MSFALYKLRTFKEGEFSRIQLFVIPLFLLTIIFYFTINLPFFVFFHQMFAEDSSKGIQLYRLINDGANYPFYSALAFIAILFTLKDNHANIIDK